MYNFRGFSLRAIYALNTAMAIAGKGSAAAVEPIHLLYGISMAKGSTAEMILSRHGINESRIVSELAMGGIISMQGRPVDVMSATTCEILDSAQEQARACGFSLAGTEHILLALLDRKAGKAHSLLHLFGISRGEVLSEPKRTRESTGILSKPVDKKGGTQMPRSMPRLEVLEKYGKDMTALARQGQLDPVFCRQEETDRVIEILLRRTKNNPCLIGDAGVGKTAIVEGLCQRIVSGNVPEAILGTRIFSVDVSVLLSGTRYRGDFEERMQKLLTEVEQNDDIVLFIDEVHLIVSAGKADGTVTDAANILKPHLARGRIRVIGATTTAEYRQSIKNDAALQRRFQPVDVQELSQEKTREVLGLLRYRYESFHRVRISDDAIYSAVDLSTRFDTGRRLPDKAIDLIDEACAYYNMSNTATAKSEIARLTAPLGLIGVTEVEKALSRCSGIPLEKIKSSSTTSVKELELQLGERLVGQPDAVSKVAKCVSRARAGIRSQNRPIASFLFAGPSGVGKTYLSEILCEQLYGNKNSYIRLDMSEYRDAHTVSRLIGAAPGYQGHEKGGELTEKVRNRPYSVVVFDEIEKASPSILSVLLQILDQGVLTDTTGVSVSFKDTIIILTTSLDSTAKAVGFGEPSSMDSAQTMSKVKTMFGRELIGRLDEIVSFKKLSMAELQQIAIMELSKLANRLSRRRINIEYSDTLTKSLATTSAQDIYGAREIRRNIESRLETLIASGIMSGGIPDGSTLHCTVDEREKISVMCEAVRV